ncbi:leucine-rich repeat domain-containing protein [Flavobacterium sp. T12S277]|uniref:leucine-rich repeat domain-containing protein n=1 Tax=Flavobacterium sp. T12S277 TaxID=3402752 RepID=UPI003AD9FBF8
MYRIEEKEPFCKKMITVFTNDFENGINYAIKEKCDGVFIRKFLENDSEAIDLSLLIPLKENLFHLAINDNIPINDVRNIEQLTNLRSIWLPVITDNLDLSYLANLEEISMKGGSTITNIDKLSKLDVLYIKGSTGKNLMSFSGSDYVKKIILADTNLENLEGIEKFPNLSSLELSYNNKLNDLSSLISMKLTRLKILKCKKLLSTDILKENKSIKDLYIDNLTTLSSLVKIPTLESIGFQDLKDGDIGIVLSSSNIKEVRFYPNKKNYTHKESEINSILKNR